MKTKNIILLLALLFLVAACTSNPPAQNPNPVPSESGSGQTPSSSSGSGGAQTGQVKEFTIRAFKFSFDPSVIEVNKGDKVKITAFSADVPHGLAIPDFKVNLRLADSTPQTAEFVADKAGTFAFFCNVPCGAGHRDMKGTLIVH